MTRPGGSGYRQYLADKYGDRVVAELEALVTRCDEIQLILDRGHDTYLADVLLQRAMEGCANRIGDTIRNKIPRDLQVEFGGVDVWWEWVDWRVQLAHHYSAVSHDRVWREAARDLPKFRAFLTVRVLGDGSDL